MQGLSARGAQFSEVPHVANHTEACDLLYVTVNQGHAFVKVSVREGAIRA